MESSVGRYAQFFAHRLRKAVGLTFKTKLRGNFDAQWYRNQYLGSDPISDPLDHYLAEGIRRGHSPNAWFDESFYVSFYSDVRGAVAKGHFACGFDHYLARGRSEKRLARHDLEQALETRMLGITTPVLLPKVEALQRRLTPIPAMRSRRSSRILWFLLPTLNPDIMFGGYRCVLELITSLVRHGRQVKVLVCENYESNREYFQFHYRNTPIGEAFSGVELFNRWQLARPLDIGPDDRFFAYSGWEAVLAHMLVALTNEQRFVFLVQEYEPIFNEYGSEHAILSNSYTFPHLPIFNSDLLRLYFEENRLGIFSSTQQSGTRPEFVVIEHVLTGAASPGQPLAKAKSGPRRLVMYARPEEHAARNLFPLGVLGLRHAIERRIFQGPWELFGIGALSTRYKVHLPEGYEITLKSRVESEKYLEFLANTDVGISLMYAPHPGLVSLELARSGARVVTNTFRNRNAQYIRSISENLIPCEPTVEGISSALQEAVAGLADVESRNRGRSIRGPRSWDDVFDHNFFERLANFC